MVVHFRKKVRRQRGNRWHGWGGKKKHRGGGSRGGRGMGGHRKHKRSYLYANKIDYFGKRGFFSGKKEIRAVNVEEIPKIAAKSGSAEIDLAKLGYDKLLGRGDIDKAYKVTVDSASKSAIEKIEAAGGKVFVTVEKTVEAEGNE